MTQAFYSNGKLLLTGEYAVLDGALSLALPTKLGQKMTVTEMASEKIIWKSLDEKGRIWFETDFQQDELIDISTPGKDANPIRKTLLKILVAAKRLNPNFLSDSGGIEIENKLGFPRDWGLGSSSTLINNIAQWAEVDAFQLLRDSFTGSGYDIACAQYDNPILYQLKGGLPEITEINFEPPFKDQLYFVHLNKKQNSREGIRRYKNQVFDTKGVVKQISEITKAIVNVKSLPDFEILINRHEALLSEILQLKRIKDTLFPDFKGNVKSLGAWGGDFVLASGNKDIKAYFTNKGYTTIIPYSEMIL